MPATSARAKNGIIVPPPPANRIPSMARRAVTGKAVQRPPSASSSGCDRSAYRLRIQIVGRPPRSRKQPEHPARRARLGRVHRVQVGAADRQVRLPLRSRGSVRHRHSRSHPDHSLDPRGAVRERAWRPIRARSRPCGDLRRVRGRFGSARLRAERRFRHHRLLPAGGGRGSSRADRPADPGRAAPRTGADAERARRGERGAEHLGGVRRTCGPGAWGSHPREWRAGARRPGHQPVGARFRSWPSHGSTWGAPRRRWPSASRAGSPDFWQA